ncbi:unnamed protein product, partial [Prorocentrum cordatum]
VQRFLKEHPERMLRDGSPTPTVMPYFDPALKRNAKPYRHFVADLRRRGLLKWTRRPRCQVGLFFVEKGNGKRLRLVLDARPASELFEAPPGVGPLCAEGLGRVEFALPEGMGPWIPEAQQLLRGFSSTWHRMRLPSWLTKYFCLPEVTALALGVENQLWEGRPLERHDLLSPCWGVFPMGFTWGLWAAQRIDESKVMEIRRPCVARRTLLAMLPINCVYVGNLGVASTSEPLVSDAAQQPVRGFDEQGSLLHGSSVSMKAINGLLRRRRLTGWAVEVLVGHCTYAGLLARGALGVCRAEPAALCPETRVELEVFRGLLIFLESDWTLQWRELVVATDSSLEAWAAPATRRPRSMVAEAGRVQDGARFREVAAGPLAAEGGGLPAARRGAREAALVAAGFWRGVGGEWRLAGAGADAELAAAWGADPGVPVVPVAGLASSRWRAKHVQRRRFEEGILIKNARSLAMGPRRVAQSVFGAACRQLILSDHVSIVLSFNWSPAKKFALLVQIRSHLTLGPPRVRRRELARAELLPAPLPAAERRRQLEPLAQAPAGARLPQLPRPAPTSAGLTPAPRRQKTLSAAQRSRDWKARLSLAALPPTPRLPERGADLPALPQDWRRQIVADSDGDSSTSDEQQVVQAGERREKELLRRAAKRKRTYGAEALQDSAAAEGQTFLRRRSVFAPARRRCGLELDAFLEFGDAEPRRPLRSPAQVDEALVDYMNALVFSGHESSKGDQVMAGLMYRFPGYSKQGESKLAPGRSRRAWPLALWRGLAWRMVARGALQMAVFLLTMVSGYFRPSHLLFLPRGDIIAPAPGVRRWWSLLLLPDSKPLRSMTALAGVGVMLDSGWFQCVTPIFRRLAQGAPEEKVWDFSCPQFLEMFRMALQGLGVEQSIFPYQARHSGPSIDVARHCRTLEEMHKRGQWKHSKSMQRYETAAGLGQSWSLLPASLRDTLSDCEGRLEDIL